MYYIEKDDDACGKTVWRFDQGGVLRHRGDDVNEDVDRTKERNTSRDSM